MNRRDQQRAEAAHWKWEQQQEVKRDAARRDREKAEQGKDGK